MPTPINAEEVLAQAIEVKQIIDAAIVPIKLSCGWYGNKFVHLEGCVCDEI